MAAKVKREQLAQTLREQEDIPVFVLDEQGNATHLVVPVGRSHLIQDDEWLRRELQIGFDQADRGEFAPLDIETIITELREEGEEQGSPT